MEALGVRYIGPVDGHDIARLEDVLTSAAASDGPVVVHTAPRRPPSSHPVAGPAHSTLASPPSTRSIWPCSPGCRA
ncbi:MAG TPA: 1-deoxy-D-xylulose-5-phosphate synthase N-terminal domain-containing protein [Acidimicrobiales bacterium]|nr:1-deoxy-D-xylulose-5-phosphate synthase N-terminal domain-containing protein [Acidimicrobiales bacterium]